MADEKPTTVGLSGTGNQAGVYKFSPDGKRMDVTPEEAAQSVVSTAGVSGDHPSILQQGAQWFNEHMGNVVGTAGAAADQVVNPAMRAAGLTNQQPMSIAEAQAKAKGLLPSSPSGVATLLGGGPLASRLGLVKGALAGAAGGAALEGASGGNPAAGAFTGGVGTAVPALAGKATNAVAGVAQRFGTKLGMRQEVIEPYAQRVLDGMKEDAPALYNAVRNLPGSAPAKLAAIHDPKLWQQSMGGVMRKAEDPIIQAMPEMVNPVQPPAAAAGAAAGAAPVSGLTPNQQAFLTQMPVNLRGAFLVQQMGMSPQQAAQAAVAMGPVQAAGAAPAAAAAPAAPKMIQTERAFANLKQMKADARDAFDPQNPAASKPLRDAARAYEDKLLDAIDQVNPKLADAWRSAMSQYNRGLRYQELGKASLKAADPSAQGAPFSPEGLVRQVFGDPARYAQSQLPGFARSFWRGAEAGAQPVITEPHIYGRLPLGSVKAALPLGQFARMPGRTYGAPNTAAALENASRAGLVNLGETVNPNRGQ